MLAEENSVMPELCVLLTISIADNIYKKEMKYGLLQKLGVKYPYQPVESNRLWVTYDVPIRNHVNVYMCIKYCLHEVLYRYWLNIFPNFSLNLLIVFIIIF